MIRFEAVAASNIEVSGLKLGLEAIRRATMNAHSAEHASAS